MSLWTGLRRRLEEMVMNTSCELPSGLNVKPSEFPQPELHLEEEGRQTAVLAGGCFWCVEAVFRQLEGVESVVSGYAGGTAGTADYRSVCSGMTDHAEVIRIEYDAGKTGYGELLRIFFSVAHDPTQLNRQGNDRGRQYRSAVFYSNDRQKQMAEAYIRQLDAAAVFSQPVVTTLEPLEAFYAAEDYHQNYAALNPGQPYIAAISTPKVEKLQAYFPESLKQQ